MEELAIKIEHVSKQYRLGAIGGGTLKGDLQSWWARVRGQEDPNSKIGSDQNVKIGERFLALDDINFEVKKGEAVGIIGHNGAGKSTLLKLLSRVTAPTEGTIYINGRIASMLEVGTGFHPEMTGRENVYLNGAILGMTRDEIDKKFDEIVEFSEVAKFIDTPVKRYSSGMYVKLAFSVAAHLDSEIMIMDEVLAVGDMAFQKKCLGKMRSAAKEDGRTVLYVSHNMNTIRQLCDRCIVMDHGQIVYNGNVEDAIQLYMGSGSIENSYKYNFDNERDRDNITKKVVMKQIALQNDNHRIVFGEKIKFTLGFSCEQPFKQLYFRFCLYLMDGTAIATSVSNPVDAVKGFNDICFELDSTNLAPDKYILKIICIELDGSGNQLRHDCVNRAIQIEVYSKNQLHNMEWDAKWWGHYVIPDASIIPSESKC